MSADVIYISYDGMTDPLGRSQVLPYLTGLATLGHRIRLVSLEKPRLLLSGGEAVRRICREAEIEWHPLPYRKRPPILSAWFNVGALRRAARRLNRERRAHFTHCRSDLAGMAGLALKRTQGVPLLYDMRAFWPDERAEGGAWDQSKPLYRAIFRYFKKRQRELVAEAEEIVVLSEEGRKALAGLHEVPRAPVTIIPCCADFDHFTLGATEERQARRAELTLRDDAPLLVHLGSIGANVMLEEMLDFLMVYRERFASAQLLFLAPDGADKILSAARKKGVEGAIHLRSANREQVPHWLAAADLGLFFVRPVFSKNAASPAKLGEMLASGLPIVTNSGVGDVASILNELGAGIILSHFDKSAYRHAVNQLTDMDFNAEQIREEARRSLDVRVGIARYDGIYRRMTIRASRG